MSEFKGTPGNWVASKSDRSIGPVSKDDDQSYGMILPVAWVEFDDRPGHHQANANLIAAAPELLAALHEFSRLYGRLWDTTKPEGGFLSPDSVKEYDRIHEMASKAISKALGR